MTSFLKTGERFHYARKFIEHRKPGFLHFHDYYEVFLVVSGVLSHHVAGKTDKLEKGHLVFIRPDDQHALQALGKTNCEIINVSFPSEIAEHLFARYGEELAGRFFWQAGPQPDVYKLDGPRLERAINLASDLQKSKRSLLAIEQFLLALLTRVVEHTAEVSQSAPEWLLAASAAAKRQDVFREGAAGFVKAACRGHEHVCRVSKKYLGMSPSEYVNRIRMEHAALTLAGTDLSISDIANECGIENLSYFYRVFQKQYGCTPKQYRERHRKDPIQAH